MQFFHLLAPTLDGHDASDEIQTWLVVLYTNGYSVSGLDYKDCPALVQQYTHTPSRNLSCSLLHPREATVIAPENSGQHSAEFFSS